MKVIVGLGNPGSKYENTRHNVGFNVIDCLSEKLHLELDNTKFNAKLGDGKVGQEWILLCKPLTYMNLSGEAVRPLLDYFKIGVEQLLVVYDDLDLPIGKIRLREKGSAGGHNGMKSVIRHLGTEDFKRIRIGIGQPKQKQDVTRYVLSSFTPAEKRLINEAVERASAACERWLSTTFPVVMNEYNKG